jgi:2-oxoglutarate ferredoxin oxidoreductase subunit beta
MQDMLYSFRKPGFTFIEVLAPCPVGFGRPNDIEDGVEEMRLYRRRSVLVYRVPEEVPWEALEVDLREERPIYVGRFVDREREVFRPRSGSRASAGRGWCWPATSWARPSPSMKAWRR